MKKLITAFAILFSLALNAQVINYPVSFVKTTTGSYSVTITRADTLTTQTSQYAESVAIQATLTKSTGTLSGSVGLWGSLDGSHWVSASTSTVSIANQTTNTYVWVLKGNPYSYYSINSVMTATATANAGVAGKILPSGSIASFAKMGTMLSGYGLSSDTITDAGSNTLVMVVSQARKQITVQPIITKISGTVGGTVTMQGSIDGVNYVTVSTNYLSTGAIYGTGAAATFTPTDVTSQNCSFVIIGSPYLYYRVSYTGTGTMAASMSAKIWMK